MYVFNLNHESDELRETFHLILHVIFHGITMIPRRGDRNEILCLFHVQGVAPGSSTSANRRKRGEREESRRNVLYLRHEAAYSPWNKDATASRTSEGRWRNVKTGSAKIITKISARFRIPEAWTTENAKKIPSKTPRIRRT